MAIKKIATKTLRQKVYEQLRQRIPGAELLPGEIVSLRGLADKFGVSLLPVREAVWQLESERILAVKSNKRIEVNKRRWLRCGDLHFMRGLGIFQYRRKRPRRTSDPALPRVRSIHISALPWDALELTHYPMIISIEIGELICMKNVPC